jgi:hypothetical protein
MMSDPLGELHTLDDVREFILKGYRQANPPRQLTRAAPPAQKLPLAVAEPAALIARAVEISGPEGISGQELRQLFGMLGADRYDRGLKLARDAMTIDWTYEKRPNRVGRMQQQDIFRSPTKGC